MPVYAYRCQSCGVQFERQQKFEDKPLTRCPECRKGTVHRVVQPPSIVFKGSGWYATDHRSPSGQTSLHKTDGEGKKTETSGDKKTEGKKAEAASTTSTTSESKPAK